MSLFDRTALGVDLSDGTLKAVQISGRGRRLTLERLWRIPLAEPGDVAAQLTALQELLAQARPWASTTLVLSAPERGLVSRSDLLPPMEASRLLELARYEILSQAGRSADDWIVRHQLRRGAGEQTVFSFALRRAPIDDFIARLAERKLPCDALEAPGCALASFWEHQSPTTKDRVLLGVGRRSTELVLRTEQGLWVRQLPLGLADGSPAEIAERLAGELHSAVEFFRPGAGQFEPQDVALSEEGALDAGFTTELKSALRLPVTRLTALQRLGLSYRLRREPERAEQALACGKAMGLALAGLGLARVRCTIETTDPARRAQRSLPLVAASVLIASALLVSTGATARQLTQELDATLPRSLQGELLDRARERDRVLGEQAALEQSAEAWLQLARRRFAALQVRPALAALQRATAERDTFILHLDQLSLQAARAGGRGGISLRVLASVELNEVLADRLRRAFQADFASVEVRGPEAPATPDGFARWAVELSFP
ncbi:MAG: type IV pilus biogenesis protein PilM [Planctomycetota bacterium]